MAGSYQTLRSPATDEYIINKSRFLCHATPCSSEEEALAFLNEKRQSYKDASHNCYAYIIGENAGIMRYSDDGEPSGTAGMPIMEVLKARHLVNCCVVITRYFGGILLGSGGLVRAYSHSAVLAVEKSGIVTMQPSIRCCAQIGYSLWDRVQYTLNQLPVQVEETKFGAAVESTVLVREKDFSLLEAALTRVSNGSIELIRVAEVYSGWVDPSENGQT